MQLEMEKRCAATTHPLALMAAQELKRDVEKVRDQQNGDKQIEL